MSTPPVCVVEDAPLLHVLKLMRDHRIVRLPVVRNRKLVGIISRPNILSQMVDLTVSMAHVLSLCYWCERVRDDILSRPDQDIWCDLSEYLDRHSITSAEVSFSPKFCPSCAPVVKNLMRR